MLNYDFVVLDIDEDFLLLKSLKTINLTDENVFEIIKNILDLIDSSFRDVVLIINKLNNHETIKRIMILSTSKEVYDIDEVKNVFLATCISIYQKLKLYGLLDRNLDNKGLPFFVQHINKSNIYLRITEEFLDIPY